MLHSVPVSALHGLEEGKVLSPPWGWEEVSGILVTLSGLSSIHLWISRWVMVSDFFCNLFGCFLRPTLAWHLVICSWPVGAVTAEERSPKIFSPKPHNLRLLPYMAKERVKLRILRWYYPGLSGWALHAIISSLLQGRRREIGPIGLGGNVIVEVQVTELQAQAKECQRPPGAGRGKEPILP